MDAWVELGAAAMVTSSIRLGTLLTPASRHRPWDLASRVGSVDRISRGRAVMSVGLGALHPGWLAYEPDEGRATRAQKLDESLAVYAGLLGGDPEFAYSGEHYSAQRHDFPQAATHAAAATPARVGRGGAGRSAGTGGNARSSGPHGGRASSPRSTRHPAMHRSESRTSRP